MNIFRGCLYLTFAFIVLFSSTNPHPDPRNFIEDIFDELIGTLTCSLDEREPIKKNLVGTWDMSLVSVNPKIPDIPLANPIKSKSTWQIIEAGNRLLISYDGSAKWYDEPPLVEFTASRPQGTPNSSKSSCVFNGTGYTSIKMVPVSILPPVIWRDISVNYNDSVSITMNSDDRATATIKVIVKGQYTEGGEAKSFNAVETITYRGVRRVSKE
jgi:hypothetical protein